MPIRIGTNFFCTTALDAHSLALALQPMRGCLESRHLLRVGKAGGPLPTQRTNPHSRVATRRNHAQRRRPLNGLANRISRRETIVRFDHIYRGEQVRFHSGQCSDGGSFAFRSDSIRSRHEAWFRTIRPDLLALASD